MKKDIVFIVIVILAGIAGIIYTKTNQTDILTAKQKQTITESNRQVAASSGGGGGSVAGQSLGIDYRSALNTYSSNRIETNINDIDVGARSLDELSSISDSAASSQNSTASDSVELRERPRWSQLYNAWYIVYVDSSSPAVNIETISSRRECELIFEFKDSTLSVVKIKSNTVIEAKDDKFVVEARNRTLEIMPLRDPQALYRASKVLIQYCESA